MNFDSNDEKQMRMAIELATRGEGCVEPNPMVGCVLVKADGVIGQGWHEEFGGPHAEVNAINNASEDPRGSTAYVSLEPCSHHGKTPPCVDALIDAGVNRVVIAMGDPNEAVSGKGIAALINAGLNVEVGLLEGVARRINAPYLKRVEEKRPWIIAKWAMTWDGKIATRRGQSQWISNTESRRFVHELRGRVDGVMIGSGTALADNPMLNARPAGPRTATRIVVDSQASLSPTSKLAQTANEYPVLVAAGPNADDDRVTQLKNLGCKVWIGNQPDRRRRLQELMTHLADEGMTNVLVEGGSKLMGGLRHLQMVDEVHVFLGAKIFGGSTAPGPVGAPGVDWLEQADEYQIQSVRQLENDVYMIGRRMTNRD